MQVLGGSGQGAVSGDGLSNILVRELELVLDADVAAGSMWRANIDMPRAPGLDAIRIKVHMEADASTTELKTLIAHALMLSPVANILHGPVDLDVALAEAPDLHA